MVQIVGTRIFGKEEYPLPSKQVDSIEALNQLVVYELDHGCSIVSISKKKILVQNGNDTLIFSGPIKEMKPVVAAACFYLESDSKFQENAFRQKFGSANLFKKVRNNYKKTSLFLAKLELPLLTPDNRLKTTALYAAGIRKPEDIKAGIFSRHLNDLLIAIQMQLAGVWTLKEALQQKN